MQMLIKVYAERIEEYHIEELKCQIAKAARNDTRPEDVEIVLVPGALNPNTGDWMGYVKPLPTGLVEVLFTGSVVPEGIVPILKENLGLRPEGGTSHVPVNTIAFMRVDQILLNLAPVGR